MCYYINSLTCVNCLTLKDTFHITILLELLLASVGEQFSNQIRLLDLRVWNCTQKKKIHYGIWSTFQNHCFVHRNTYIINSLFLRNWNQKTDWWMGVWLTVDGINTWFCDQKVDIQYIVGLHMVVFYHEWTMISLITDQ